MKMCSLSDKVAIVTGASKGIGRGIATAFGAAGARVAVNYSSDRDGAERVVQAIIDTGGKAIAVGADVSKAEDVARLFQGVHAAFGRLDVLVNNAGIFRFSAFADITEENFHAHYNISRTAPAWRSQVLSARPRSSSSSSTSTTAITSSGASTHPRNKPHEASRRRWTRSSAISALASSIDVRSNWPVWSDNRSSACRYWPELSIPAIVCIVR